MATKNWFLKVDDEILGPFSSNEISELAGDGTLTPRSQVSPDGQSWKFARNIRGLEFRGGLPDTSDQPVVSPPPPLPPSQREQAHSDDDNWFDRILGVTLGIVHSPAFAICGLGVIVGIFRLGIVPLFRDKPVAVDPSTRPVATTDSGIAPSRPIVRRINLNWSDATAELQQMAARLTTEERTALGLTALFTGSDLYAARVRITNTGTVPVQVSPDRIRISVGDRTGSVATSADRRFLQPGVLQPNYYFEGLVIIPARMDFGAAIRLGGGAMSYEDAALTVTFD